MIRYSHLGVSSSITFTNPASFLCCSVSVAILVFCASTAARIEVNSSIASGLPSCCCDYSGSFCCFSLSKAALMFLLLLLLAVVKERLRALRGEVRREGARALAALGAAGPPPNGGNGVIRGTTRRRHAASQFLMLQNPHQQPASCTTSPTRPGRRADWREKTRPTQPLQWLFREKVRPASVKTPIVGCFERARRTFSRSRPPSDHAGRTFSRTRRDNVATLKPTTPLLTPEQQPLKPPSPLHPKTPNSHPQWR